MIPLEATRMSVRELAAWVTEDPARLDVARAELRRRGRDLEPLK